MFKPILHDEFEIASYIEENSPYEVDTDLIRDLFFNCHAKLKEVEISLLVKGSEESNLRDIKKENKYSKMNIETMPPIVVCDGDIQDGHHRVRVLESKNITTVMAYVIEEGRIERD